LVKSLIALVETGPEHKWGEADLKSRGIDPSTARRQFQARFGMSFSAYARARRLGSAAQARTKGQTVMTAQLTAGYDSPSGFRDAFAKTFGMAPKNAPKNKEAALKTSGTEFQNATWDQLRQIPYGETRSYLELAHMVGSPKGFRAVANSNANNGLAIIIPCHRVIASGGGLGGYARNDRAGRSAPLYLCPNA